MIEKLFQVIFFPAVYLLSVLWPKDDNLWLFSAWFGRRFEDSPRTVFETCHRQSSAAARAYWIYKGEKPRSPDIPAEFFVHCYSVRGIYLQLRARVFVLCVNSRDFLPGAICFRSFVVQTWHGTPMKKIGYTELAGRPVSILKFWIRWLLAENYDVVISPDSYTDRVFCDAFQVTPEKLLRCNYPRNMAMFLDDSTRQKIRKEIAKDPNRYLWLYLPTHRSEGADGRATRRGYDEILSKDEELFLSGLEVLFKPHYYEEGFFVDCEEGKSVHKLKSDLGVSLYQVLGAVDGLITDYSSVAFDYQAVSKNILIFAFDVEDFRRTHRELIRLPSDDFEVVLEDSESLVHSLCEMSKTNRGERASIPADSSEYLIQEIASRVG